MWKLDIRKMRASIVAQDTAFRVEKYINNPIHLKTWKNENTVLIQGGILDFHKTKIPNAKEENRNENSHPAGWRKEVCLAFFLRLHYPRSYLGSNGSVLPCFISV